jgi:hypothetical protein
MRSTETMSAVVYADNVAKVLRAHRDEVMSRTAPTVRKYEVVRELDSLLRAALTALEHVSAPTPSSPLRRETEQ